MNLKNKVAVVTGSSSGIGEAIALALAKEGVRVVVNSLKDAKSGQKVVEKIKKSGGEAIYLQADMSSPAEVNKFYKEILNIYQNIDILVNNVGNSEHGEMDNYDIWSEQFVSVLLTNVIATAELFKFDTNKVKKILNISSIYGLPSGSDPAFMAFAAAKAGVNSLTVNLANKFGENTQVNALALGYVWTRHWGESREKWNEGMEKASKLKRFIEVEEVADIALSTIKNDALNGQIITLDGGATLKNVY